MDQSKLQETDPFFLKSNGFINGQDGFCEVDCKSIVESTSLSDEIKCCVLNYAVKGAEKVLLDRKHWKINDLTNGISGENGKDEGCSSDNSHSYAEYALTRKRSKANNMSEENGREKSRRDGDTMEASKYRFGGTSEWNCENGNAPHLLPGGYSEFPFNFAIFFALLSMKFMVFQINLLISFLTFPVWLLYFWFMFLMFPFQTLRHVRGYFIGKIFSLWHVSAKKVTKKAQQSVGTVAVRLGCAAFWASYVFLMISGLLASGFVFGSLLMRHLVEKPIQMKESLNFDYTKASPVAFVPIMPYSGVGDPSALFAKENVEGKKQVSAGVIPHNHKLQIGVSLVMPESDYNRKLGVFQVRVESIAASGKVTASSSYPCMLRFKSQPIRFVEAIIRSAPLLAGYQTESQIINIKTNDFVEGIEPTAFLKATIQGRAEFEDGAGIPEIYAAALSLESELPRLKRLIWNWKKTILVWTSIVIFLNELMLVLVFCRPIIIPRGMAGIKHSKKELPLQ